MIKAIKIYLFLFCLTFCNFSISAHQNEKDSLTAILELPDSKIHDTARINTLIALAKEHMYSNPDTAITISKKALPLAERLQSASNSQEELFLADMAASKVYNSLGALYRVQSNYILSLDYYLKALAICEQWEYKQNTGNLRDNLTIAPIYDMQIAANNGIGVIYKSQGNYPKALNYYYAALGILETIKDEEGIVSLLISIGSVHKNLNDFSKALEYYFKALEIVKKTGDENKYARLLSSIGIVYYNQNNYTEALNYYFKALKLVEKTENKNGIAVILGNIGNVYSDQGDLAIAHGDAQLAQTEKYPLALKYYLNTLEIDKEYGDQSDIAIDLGNIGALYTSMKKYKEAEDHLQQALLLDNEIGALDQAMEDEQALSNLYFQMGEAKGTVKNGEGYYKSSLEHYKKYVLLKDSIFNEENTKKNVRSEMNYEFEKQQAQEKAEQDKKDAIAIEELRRQKQQRNYFIIGFALMLIFALLIYREYKQKQKANKIIIQQKEEVEKQKELVEQKNKIVEEKNKEITDSITYAKRIQNAKFPKKEDIYAHLAHSFILFKPKDIVSGDFYFFCKKNNHPGQKTPSEAEKIKNAIPTSITPIKSSSIFIAAADCTGHGVPGAFMSMIGFEKIENAINQSNDTSEILKLLNIGVKASLQQSERLESTRDGMDIAIVRLEFSDPTKNSSTLHYAGANRPLWLIRENQKELEEIKATKTAIGGLTENNTHFETHQIQLKKGDTFYIFSDGYADQFGGEKRKKLMTKQFKEILLSIQHQSMQEQEKYLDTFIESWKGETEQVDDILVIGVRI